MHLSRKFLTNFGNYERFRVAIGNEEIMFRLLNIEMGQISQVIAHAGRFESIDARSVLT